MPGMLLAMIVSVTFGAEPPDLAALAAEAITANPSVAALTHREQALRDEARVAGAWPDPRIVVEYSNAPVTTFSLSEHPMSGVQLRLEQTLRPPGWSRARRSVGDLEAAQGEHAIDELREWLTQTVARTYWALTESRVLHRITAEHIERTEELLGAIRSRYETGSVGQSALLQLELLRDRLAEDLRDLEARDVALTASLRETVAADPGRTFTTPATVDALPPPAEADWRALATTHRPALRQLEAERQSAEEGARVARLDALPDPQVFVGYRVRTIETPTDPGTDFASIGVAVPIPAGSARRAGGERRAALQRADGAASMFRATLDDIEAEMTSIVAGWRRAWERTRAFDGSLIPSARGVLATTQSDFTVGRADVASLFDAEVALLDLERARVAAAIETHRHLADATATLGTAPPGDAP